MTSVSQMDLESDSLFPHIPMSSNWEERKPRTQEADGSIRGDLPNIMLLMFLYILQGIPLGLAGSIPMLLQSRKVRMCQKFSFFSVCYLLYVFFVISYMFYLYVSCVIFGIFS